MNKVILLTLVFILGIFSANLGLKEVFASGMILFICIICCKKYLGKTFSIILITAFILSVLNYSLRTKEGDILKEIGYKNNIIMKGRIVTIPENIKDRNKIRFYFDVMSVEFGDEKRENIKAKTFVTVNNNSNIKNLKIGNIVGIRGKLRIPSSATNPYQFDYSKYLTRKNVFTTFYAENDSHFLIKKPDYSSKDFIWKIFQVLDHKRECIIAHHAKYLKSPNLEVLGGIVFGDDAINPPEDIKEKFIGSGLLHLLAASGLNVALIFGIWWFLGTRLSIGYRGTIVFGILLILLYSAMTGFPPSILRASLMLLFVLVGKLFDLKADSLSLVFFVGLLLLAANPAMLFDVGFELSFVVTIGLIFALEKISLFLSDFDEKYKKFIEKRAKFYKKFTPSGIICTILTPFVAQLSVAPIQLYYFNTFTPYSFFANICILPFIGLISCLGFMSSIFSMFGFDFIVNFSDKITDPLVSIVINISYFFADLKGAVIYFPSPNFIQIVIYYMVLGLIFYALAKKFKVAKVLRVVLILILIFVLSSIKLREEAFEIMAFDVGNSDSFLIATPENKHIMIDTGKLPYRGKSQAEMIINKYLRNKGIKKIDLMILTHFDIDHAGGATDIVKSFEVEKTIIEKNESDNRASKEFLKLAKGKIEVKKVENGEIVYKEPNLKITTYANLLSKKSNDASVITFVEYKDAKALFMGDATSNSFKIIDNKTLRDIDILKVGHHGAKKSVDDFMLNKLKPEIAIISTGFNTYGHPDYSTLECLRKHNVMLYSTKELGAVEFKYREKENNFEIQSFKKDKLKR